MNEDNKASIADTEKQQRLETARIWLERAIARGHDPIMREREAWEHGGRGWQLSLCYVNIDRDREAPGPVPMDLWPELERLMEPMGRVHPATGAMPWHQDMFSPKSEPHIIAARLREARAALRLAVEEFYQPAGVSARAAREWEKGERKFERGAVTKFAKIAQAHDLSPSWLFWGHAAPFLRRRADAIVGE